MAYYAPGMGRAFHPRAVNFSRGWVHTSTWNLISMPILQFTQEIRNAVLMVHGENAHSRYFSEDAYKNMTSGSGEKCLTRDTLVGCGWAGVSFRWYCGVGGLVVGH